MNDRPEKNGLAGEIEDGTGGSPQRDHLVERLLEIAESGPEIPAGGADRIKDAIRPQWQREVRARSWRRRLVWLGGGVAAAASLTIAVLVVQWIGQSGRATAEPVGTIAAVSGDVEVVPPTGPARRVTAADVGTDIAADAWIRTGDDSRIALRLSRGQSLRLDVSTRARIDSHRVVALDRGGLYVDTDRGTDGGVEVHTVLGIAREVGTQFEVRRDDGVMSVRVREGAVVLTRDGEELDIPHGTALKVFEDGAVETTRIPVFGPEWDWVQQVAPPFDIEGRTVVAFLDWVSQETGLWIHFQDPEVERFAGETVLYGTVEGLTPAQAPEVVLASCGLTATRAAGTLTVRRPETGGGKEQ
jgi:hypothetical protein